MVEQHLLALLRHAEGVAAHGRGAVGQLAYDVLLRAQAVEALALLLHTPQVEQSAGAHHADLVVGAEVGVGAAVALQVDAQRVVRRLLSHHALHRGGDVELQHGPVNALGGYASGGVEEQRHVVVRQRHVVETGARGSVVGHEDEQRVLEPRLLGGEVHEVARAWPRRVCRRV